MACLSRTSVACTRACASASSGRCIATASGPTGGIAAAGIVAFVAGLVMLVMVIGALVKLGMQKAWGWFVGVLVLQLIGLGIIGMVAYAIAGPADSGREVVTRPMAG